ncbi:helix-turn-helix domain-containing protein [Foetidibacter luteolus]|uniref:helix-turn-helix domain-containing protein n=1 Tax=Foetidibacter luteolus TaxID=2608880 RepID=UPI00129ADDF7|nr:helix-turn-helix transcriptional regulator [Foetidibacter luteolus]
MKRNRERNPLTQRQLAQYLLVSHGKIAMYETGGRFLPREAMQKLARLETALAKNDGTLTASAQQQLQEISVKEKKALQQEVDELTYQLIKTARKIERMQKKYSKAMQVLQAIPALLQSLVPGEQGEYDKLWLQVTEADMLQKLVENSPGMQQKLKLHKETLEFQLSGLRSLLAD